MRTRLEVCQRLDSRFRGNDKQGGNDEGDAFPWSPYPKLGLLLRKRFIIETLFNKLKSGMGLQHTRHRSPINALVHIVSCLAAYALAQPKGAIANSGHIPIPNCSSLP